MEKNKPEGPTYYSGVYDLRFYVLGNDENELDSCVNITNKEVMKGETPMPEGVYDPHMGTTDHSWNCSTCFNRKSVCPGHFGSVELRYPVKSPMFREELLKWLKITCYYCGALVASTKKNIIPSKRMSELIKNVKKAKTCPNCDMPHMQVAKDKRRPMVFYRTQEEGKILKLEEYYNHLIEAAVNRISDDTVASMGLPLTSHPSNYMLRTIRAPPNTIRPDIRRVGGARSSNSDTTTLLKTIVEINEKLPDDIPVANQINEDLRNMYFNLDMTYYAMVKGGGGGEIKLVTNTNKPPVAIAEHFPKKQGRIRRNLMGKRVSYMIRSVITGDSHLRIDEVGVPMIHAKNLEIPETVSKSNITRLSVYYTNGIKAYPGCKRIIKKADGHVYRIEHMDKNYKLQIGDIVLRDMISGDVVNFNRAPSLLFSNIATMKIVVMETGDTLRINPSVCNYFNADFDGDQMNAIVSQNIMARNESMEISKVSRWFVSPKNHAPLIGSFQDGLIGIYELTKDGLTFNKWHAMQLFAAIRTSDINYKFAAKTYNNRELVSRLLPKINMVNRTPNSYKEQYAPMIKYNPKDTVVNIKRGVLESGVLDSATVGQDVAGSVYHIIANERGNDYAMECVYNMQQIVHKFFLYHGFTTGISDINISESAMEKIKQGIASLILDSYKITQRLNTGKLIAPLGMSLKQFYEDEQMQALTPGDSFVYPIIADTDVESNGMLRLILSGSKGKFTNFISINGAIGQQTINGKRFGEQVGIGRTSPYFLRYDTSPAASGYVSMSFREGVSNQVYPFMAGEARFGLISNALSTSITGYQNRISVKNLESITVDNSYKSTKGANVVQCIYADCGLNGSKMEKVKLPTLLISDEEFKQNYKAELSDVDERFRNSEVKRMLDDEFAQLVADRKALRDAHFRLEHNNPREYIIENTKYVPVNVQRILDDVSYNYEEMYQAIAPTERILDPVYAVEAVRSLSQELGYVFMNDNMRRKKAQLPERYVKSVECTVMLMRAYLCVKSLSKKKIINATLDIIIRDIETTYKKALIDYGSSVGILAAQCISEPMTQFILDSKHRTGGQGGTKTNEIVRIQEILGARSTADMKNPHMLIMVKREYENDKFKVQEIANHIEMMQFSRFIQGTQIFFESYGAPTHPDYKHEAAIIDEIDRYNKTVSKPNDLTKWCIRFDINKEELILKSMKLETLVLALRKNVPQVYIVYNPENSKSVFIRCYLKNSFFKPSQNYYHDAVQTTMKKLTEVVVRGITGLINTSVIDVICTNEKPDGSLSRDKVYGIAVVGTNMAEVLNNEFIDPYRTQSDSIEEMERIFGVAAARDKIIYELHSVNKKMNPMHCGVFADEMTYSGSVTSIQRSGLQEREMANVSLRLSFQTPVQVIQSAAVNGLTDRIMGISGPLIMGSNPRVGTVYNSVCLNEQFIKENTKSLENVLEDL